MKVLILAITILVLAAIAATVIVGVKSYDGVVTEHPYAEGLKWSEERKQKAELGWKVEILNKELTTGRNELRVRVKNRRGQDQTGRLLSLLRTRSFTSRYDKDYDLHGAPKDPLRVPLEFPLSGRWVLKFRMRTPLGEEVFEKKVFVKRVGSDEAKDPSGVNCVPEKGPCVQRIGEKGFNVSLDIDPTPVQAMKTLTFHVSLFEKEKPVENAKVHLSLSMPGMYMGENRPEMRSVGEGRFVGKGILPRCMSGKKIWQAEITVLRENEQLKTNFIFEIQ
jgi:nitrogen fixation protein FixH